MLAENLADRAAIAGRADGLGGWNGWRRCSPRKPPSNTGIAPDTVRGLARDLVRTPRAAVYGRVAPASGATAP